ncbi:MAG: FadR family transcriptional regulator [Desulfofustis sp.]|nr:FadR family transcriptional regulator [Desulfofustis sp.]
MELTPISRKRLSESAINQIKDFIIQNGLGPGAKLPSERELCKQLQISRASIREAIRILEIMGLVEVMPGKGIFVKDLTGDLFVPLPTWVSDYRDTIHKHFEARLILEPEIAALAARRATAADIEKIRQNIALQGSLPESEMAAIIQADIDFHCLIAEAAKNETLLMLLNSIARMSFHGWKAALRTKSRNTTAVQEHLDLVAKLVAHDEAGARTMMREHMLGSIQMLKDQGLVPES